MQGTRRYLGPTGRTECSAICFANLSPCTSTIRFLCATGRARCATWLASAGKMVTVLIDGLTINVAERLGKSCWKSIRDEVLSVYQRKELSVSIILPGKRDVGYKRRRCRTADNRPPNIRYARVG